MRLTLGNDTGDFAVLRRPDAMRGDGIALMITPRTRPLREQLRDALDRAVREMGVNASGAISIHEMAELPRTASGKLRRRVLENAQLEAETVTGKQVRDDANQGGFAALLEGFFGHAIDPAMSFVESGGDSLIHMQIALSLERTLGTAPEAWEWQPMADLIARVNGAGDLEALTAKQSGAPPLPDGSRNMNPEGIGFWALVAEDFRTNDRSLTHQGFLMLLVHRFGNWRMSVRPKILRMPLSLLYKILNKLTQILFGMKLDYTVKVGRRVKLEHFGGMILGAR
jgi:hypothetical protein